MEQEYVDLDEVDEGGDSYEADETDDMLDALMEAAEDGDFVERKRRRGRRKRGAQRQVPAAKGKDAYRAPVPPTSVTQKQLEDALTRVGGDVRRNAMGIKTLNGQIGRLNGQVSDVVAVNRVQNDRLTRFDKQLRIDAALDFVQGLQVTKSTTPGSPAQITPDLALLIRGAIKSGMLGDMKGALGNPLLIGGAALFLSKPDIVSGLLGR